MKYKLDEQVLAPVKEDLWGNQIKKKFTTGVVEQISIRKPVKITPLPKKRSRFFYDARGGIFYLVLFMWPTIGKGFQQQELWFHEDELKKKGRS